MANEWTQEDIDTLKSAIRSGVLSVSYAGPPQRMVTYQSLSEMRKLLAEMIGQVEGTAGTRRRYTLASTKKGFYS